MNKLILVTTALLAAENFEALKATVVGKPEDAAADLLTLAKENEDLRTDLENLTASFSQLQVEAQAVVSINQELEAQIAALPGSVTVAEKPTVSDKTFTVEKKTYGFAYPQLKLEGTVITAADVLADVKLQKKLVEMGSGFIKLV